MHKQPHAIYLTTLIKNFHCRQKCIGNPYYEVFENIEKHIQKPSRHKSRITPDKYEKTLLMCYYNTNN